MDAANRDGKINILLVDDEQDITNVLKRGLENKGNYRVDAFNDPQQALAHFKTNYYDAIILDLRMPGMDGFGLSREIWKRDTNVQICFMTAFEIYEKEARVVFSHLPSYCFIKKPIAAKALDNHIQRHMLQRAK